MLSHGVASEQTIILYSCTLLVDIEGYVDFVCGPCPGNDGKFVDVDLLGASY